MAIMIPEKLSPDTLANPGKQGEVKVYNLFKEKLGKDWTVCHSVSWLGKVYASGDQRDGETDFIIANPKYGIIIAEVKGGIRIEYNGMANKWFSISGGGKKYQIKDPYIQARDNKYSFITNVKTWRRSTNGIGVVNICHAVVFPDTSFTKGSLPLYAKRAITIVEDDFTDIKNVLINIIKFSCNNKKIDEIAAINLIRDIRNNIAPSFLLERKLVHVISEEEKEFINLTEQQYSLLKVLQKIRRASISGCAGSGKTMLAIKKAEMVAGSGFSTLLCCFNTLLGKELHCIESCNEGITGGNYHSIMHKILGQYFGLAYKDRLDILNNESKLLDLLLQSDLPKYDAIIIDEGQDFSAFQLEVMELMLVEGGVFYVFWDNNQRVMRSDFGLPFNLQEFDLDTNLRNTKKIFNEVKKYYYQEKPIDHIGPDGWDVKYCSTYNFLRTKELKQRLSQEITELIKTHSIKPDDITILTFKSKENSALVDFSLPGMTGCCFSDDLQKNSIRVETVRRFKGLESPVVIVTELDEYYAMNDVELWENLCYIAFSRAKNYLVIVCPNNAAERIGI